MPTIELRSVSKHFGRVKALTDVSLTVDDGEYVVILGPSGCGKTTLLNMISGILKPTKGHVLIDGQDVTRKAVEERNLSFVFQNIALFPHMTVRENVQYSPLVRGKSLEEVEGLTNDTLKLVELLGLDEKYPHELPAGTQQKVALARAFATEARLIILDEPISALDPEVRVNLRHKLRQLVKKIGLTAIHVTHDQDVAMSVADRIILMKRGSIVQFARPEDMYNKPQSLFEAFFVGQGNFLEGYIRKLTENQVKIRFRHGKDVILDKQPFFPLLEEGQAVVVFSRPENVIIRKEDKKNGLLGSIQRRVLMGGYVRYEIRTLTEDLILVDMRLTKRLMEVKEKVYVVFPPKTTLILKTPPNGLEEELRLE